MQGVERNRHQDSEENWAQERLNQKVAEVEHQRRQDHQNDCHRVAVAVHAVAQILAPTGRKLDAREDTADSNWNHSSWSKFSDGPAPDAAHTPTPVGQSPVA